MKVGFSNNISFRADNLQTISNGNSDKQYISSLKNILADDYAWSKKYYPKEDVVIVASKIATDMGTYTIQNDGTVISDVNYAQRQPIVVIEKNKNMADYVKNMKEHSEILDKFSKDVSFKGNEDPVEESKVSDVKPSKTMKDRAANVWKFFAATNQMGKSSLKGIFYGALTGVGFLGGSWLFASLPKAFAKEGPKLKDIVRHPLKHIGKSGKIMAGIAAGAVLGYQLVVGKMTANQKTAVIDHKMKTGHRDK